MTVINDTAKTSQAIAKVSSTPRPAASRGTSRFSRGGFSRGYTRNAPKAATATTSAAPEPSTSGKEQQGVISLRSIPPGGRVIIIKRAIDNIPIVSRTALIFGKKT